MPPGGPVVFSIHGMYCTQNIRPEQQGVAPSRIITHAPAFVMAPPQQMVQFVPIQGRPDYYQHGNTMLRCSTASRVVGGGVGALVGYVVGKNITLDSHRFNSLGAITGGALGQQIGCEMVGSTMASSRHMVVPYPGANIPAEQQVGGFGNDGNVTSGYLSQTQRGRTVYEPSDCDVGTVKDLKGLTREQCRRVQQAMKVSEPSNCHVGSTKDRQGLSSEECDHIRTARTVTYPGHCIVGGVPYPEFIDNEPGCEGKRNEIRAKGNLQRVSQASERMMNPAAAQTTGLWGYKPDVATPQNPLPCFVTAPVQGTKPGCSSVTPIPPQPGETRDSWEARVSKM